MTTGKTFAELAAQARENGAGTVRTGAEAPPPGRYYALAVWWEVKPSGDGVPRLAVKWKVDHGPQLGKVTFSGTRYDPTHDVSISVLGQIIENLGHTWDEMNDLDGLDAEAVLTRVGEWIDGQRAEINVKDWSRNGRSGVEARWINRLPSNAPEPQLKEDGKPEVSQAGNALKAMAAGPKPPTPPASGGRPAI